VPVEVLRRGVAAGLFDGMTCIVEGRFWYAPDLVPLIARSDKLGDVLAGRLSHHQAKRLLLARARQLRRRTACSTGVWSRRSSAGKLRSVVAHPRARRPRRAFVW